MCIGGSVLVSLGLAPGFSSSLIVCGCKAVVVRLWLASSVIVASIVISEDCVYYLRCSSILRIRSRL